MEDMCIYLNRLIILTVNVNYLEKYINVYENIYRTNIPNHKKGPSYILLKNVDTFRNNYRLYY